MLELLLEITNSIVRHGLSWAAAISIVTALYRYRKVLLKILHRGHEQETQLDQIQRDIKLIKSHLGVTECVERPISSTNTVKPLSRSSQVVGLFARSVVVPMHRVKIYLSRGNRTMKKKLTSRKLWMSIVSAALVIANEGFDLGISNESVMAFAAIVMSFIFSQGYVDAKEKKVETYGDSGPAE